MTRNHLCTMLAPPSTVSLLADRIGSWVHLLFLFLRTDIKTTLIPTSILAFSIEPTALNSPLSVVLTVLWVALNLLQFTVSNQSVPKSVNEDRINKPFRAIPSGKISVYHATILRWVLVPVCIGHSMLYSLLATFTSAFLIILTILYNEFDISSNGPLRNVFNALGYACFGSGAILVASPDPSKLSNVALKAITLNLFFVLLTTIHAQDFQDVDGDKEVGRITLPMMMPPSIARSTLLILLVTWSFILSKVWAVSAVVLLGYLGLATLAGLNYVLYETVEDDHCSYRIYNVWLAFTWMLPAMSRFKDTS